MVQITDNRARHYVLPSDDSGVLITKFTRINDDGAPSLQKNVVAVTNTQQTAQLFNNIQDCVEQIGIDISLFAKSTDLPSERINIIRMQTLASKNLNGNKILFTEHMIDRGEKIITNNNRMIYQMEESNQPFFRISKDQVKGYKKNLWHSCKMIMSDKYRRSVEGTKKLARTADEKHIKEKLLEINQIQNNNLRSEYSSLLALHNQREQYDQLLNKIEQLSTRLSGTEATEHATANLPAAHPASQRAQSAKTLVNTVSPPTDTHTPSASQTAVKQIASPASTPQTVKKTIRPAPAVPINQQLPAKG